MVDGADVIYSMDGRLAHATSYYVSKKLPHMFNAEAGDVTQIAYIPLKFGRWLWDPIVALDPSKFKNLQLKITWNLAAVNAVGSTGFATDTAKLSVIARVMEGLETPPTHFMMHKDQYSWTTGASGDERVALPTDYPYAMLMIRAFEAGVQVSDSIENVKLNIDFDKVIPIDMSITDIKGLIVDQYGIIEIDNRFKGDDNEAHEAWLGDVKFISAIGGARDILASASLIDAGRYTLRLITTAGVDQLNVEAFVIAKGQLPWNCIIIPFGIIEDPTTYLQAQAHGDIKAILTQGNVGAEANVVLTQLRNYGAAA